MIEAGLFRSRDDGAVSDLPMPASWAALAIWRDETKLTPFRLRCSLAWRPGR